MRPRTSKAAAGTQRFRQIWSSSRMNFPQALTSAAPAFLAALSLLAPSAHSQQTVDTTDFGPFVAVTVDAPNGNRAMKGVVVRLGKQQNVAVCYDTELLRVSGGWVGIGNGWQHLMEYRSTSFSANHGQANVPKGEMN